MHWHLCCCSFCGHHCLKKHIKMEEVSRHRRYVWPEGKCHLASMFRMSTNQLNGLFKKKKKVITRKKVMHFKRKPKKGRPDISFLTTCTFLKRLVHDFQISMHICALVHCLINPSLFHLVTYQSWESSLSSKVSELIWTTSNWNVFEDVLMEEDGYFTFWKIFAC